MYRNEFIFGQNHITSDHMFSKESGFGFVDFSQIEGATKSEQSLYAGGWNLRQSQKNCWRTAVYTTADSVVSNEERFVIIFKILVPEEGTYKVNIQTTAGSEQIQNMMLFCGRRNLIEKNISVFPNETYSKSFFTLVAPYIPAMTSIPCTEKAIYISITGKHASLSKITVERTDSHVLFVAGDSTLTDQNALMPYYPYGSCGGWAQMLPQYLNNLAVCNQAHSGMTTNCFRDDGHWDILLQHIHEKDIVMFQFGHNDQKRRNLSAFGGYINNLRWYIKEIQKRGAYPIILSPISRIPFSDNGVYRSLLTAHANAAKAAADECNVPFIDLHNITFSEWKLLGEEKTHDFFMKGDITHTNDYGANLIASYVASEIFHQKISCFSEYIIFDDKNITNKNFIPDNDTKDVPTELSEKGMFDVNIPYVDIDGIPQYEDIVNSFKKGLLDPCVMHLHPSEIMPRAQFLMMYFNALRISGKRPYLGTFCDMSRFEWDSSYVQTCIDENLIDFTTVPNSFFRPDDALTYEEYSSFLIRGMQKKANQRDLPLTFCIKEAINKGLISGDCDPKAPICRADCIKGLVKLMEHLDTSDKALPSDAEIHPVG